MRDSSGAKIHEARSAFADPKVYLQFRALYQRALQQWERIPEIVEIPTRCGISRGIHLTPQRSISLVNHPEQGKEKNIPAEPVVVLLHGFDATSLIWQSIMPGLAHDYECIALDIPGQVGLSTNDGSQRLRHCFQYVQWLEETLHQAGYSNRPLILIGYSYGGNIAARFASIHRERIHHLMLIEPAVVFNIIRLNFLWEFLGMKKTVLSEATVQEILEERAKWDYYNPYTEEAIAYGLHYYRRRNFVVPLPIFLPRLTRLGKKVTVILGGKSEILHAFRAKTVAHLAIPRAQVTVFPEATHSLPGQYAQQILEHIHRFCAPQKS